jgi:hypothetical protein
MVDRIPLRGGKQSHFLASFTEQTEPRFKKSERLFEKSVPISTARASRQSERMFSDVNAMFNDINAMCSAIAVMVYCKCIGHVITLHLAIFTTTIAQRMTHGAELAKPNNYDGCCYNTHLQLGMKIHLIQ